MGLTNPTHLLFLVVIIALVFGSSKVPGMARSAGKHAREARDGVSSFKQEFDIDGNPLADVVDTVRSANPKTIVRDAAKKAASPPAKKAASPSPAKKPPQP